MGRQKITGIYKITSPTGCIYIGQSLDIERRFSEYQNGKCKYQTRLLNSFNKHGVGIHKFEIIEKCELDLINDREIFWIAHFNTFGTTLGLNLRNGGSNGKMSEETKALISKNNARHNKGKIGVISEDTREKIRQARLKQPDPNLGKKRSDEIKKKFSEMRKGIKSTPEALEARKEGRLRTKEAFDILMRGPERVAAIAEKNRGKKRNQKVKDSLSRSWNYDKHFTAETRAKISEAGKRRWAKYHRNKLEINETKNH